jgi:hypothetical protein
MTIGLSEVVPESLPILECCIRQGWHPGSDGSI